MKMLAIITLVLLDAAGDDKSRYVCPVHPDGGEWKLVKAVYVPNVSVAIDATNYRTISLENGSDTLGSIVTNATALTAGTPVEFTLTGGLALEFTANADTVLVDSAADASGAVADGQVILSFERIS